MCAVGDDRSSHYGRSQYVRSQDGRSQDGRSQEYAEESEGELTNGRTVTRPSLYVASHVHCALCRKGDGMRKTPAQTLLKSSILMSSTD